MTAMEHKYDQINNHLINSNTINIFTYAFMWRHFDLKEVWWWCAKHILGMQQCIALQQNWEGHQT